MFAGYFCLENARVERRVVLELLFSAGQGRQDGSNKPNLTRYFRYLVVLRRGVEGGVGAN